MAMSSYTFIFDENKCVGCEACVIACANENNNGKANNWRKIKSSNQQNFPNMPSVYLSSACNHCEESPCLNNCPANAYTKDILTSAILHDSELCIGCQYCTWICPFSAPVFNKKQGTVTKCSMCIEKLKKKRNSCLRFSLSNRCTFF